MLVIVFAVSAGMPAQRGCRGRALPGKMPRWPSRERWMDIVRVARASRKAYRAPALDDVEIDDGVAVEDPRFNVSPSLSRSDSSHGRVCCRSSSTWRDCIVTKPSPRR